VPKMNTRFELMMKCDMCYDRTSAGRKPMCATVCPSGALFYGPRHKIEQLRPRSTSLNRFQFGNQTITTKVNVMAPRRAVQAQYVDVAAVLSETGHGKTISLDLLDTLHTGKETP